MWNEMCDNIHTSRSMTERLRYENDNEVQYDEYTQYIIDTQEVYDDEYQLDKFGNKVEDIYAQ